MKEIIVSIWLSIGSLLGIEEEKVEKPTDKAQETSEQVATESSPPTVAAESSTETKDNIETTDKEMVDKRELEYEVPEDAPWMTPVAGSGITSESVQEGQEGQVTTIWGNGTQAQNERNMDTPRDLGVDSKGNIYFVDGNQSTAKLRVFDGTQNKTVVDLVANKITQREGYFASAGLAIIHDNVYISSTEDVFLVKNGRITQFTPKIRAYMDSKRLENIYRIERYKDYLYIMFYSKGKQFHIARYNVNGGAVEQIIETKPMSSPYNFYVHGENEIFIASKLGYVIWEVLFPRDTKIAWEFGDPNTEVTDVWIGSNDSMYMVAWADQVKHIVYENPVGIDASGLMPFIGSRRGFVDGFNDEVELDYPIDFVWDGTGYLFADMGNHSIRKVWTEVGPMKK
jgi:hypothetical protein